MRYQVSVQFEFDPWKTENNKAKHGIDFVEAQALWKSKHVLLGAKDASEKRYMVIGRIGSEHWSGIITYRDALIRIIRTHLINRKRCVAGDLALQQGARRKNILHGSLTDEHRRCSDKGPQPSRAKLWRAAGGVAPQSQSALAMLIRRALPATRQNLAHPFPSYEMGSSVRRSTAAEIETYEKIAG